MAIKAKSGFFLFLPILLYFFSFGISSLGYQVPYPKTDKERCLERCHETEKDFSGLISCASHCERKYENHREEKREGEEISPRDPKSPRWKIERCQQQCRREESDDRQLQRCQKRCEEEVIKERERETEDPRVQYERCQELCDREPEREKPQCQRRCERQFEEKQKEREERGAHRGTRSRELEKRRDNPYYFHAQRLQSRHKTQEGHISVLEKFSDRSELLRRIENYRLSTLEANPNTFVVPHHCDAESIVVVLRGKGTITCVLRDERRSYNLEKGDVIRIPAGATLYLINRDSNAKLNMVKLMQPVNSPGNFREYFAAGGDNPESFYTVFSNDVLESALDTPRDQLDRIFGQQRQGVIPKVPQEHLKALSRHILSTKQKGHESEGPFNLLKRQPLYSNRFGNFIEASLQDVDISVSYVEIERGALMVPHYNSKATMIALVVEGAGRFEMASPHLASQRMDPREELPEGTRQYQKISSDLSPGDVFITPAGHPVAVLASHNQNLILVGFAINARDNQRNFLAGRDNIMNQIEREAKELSFNSPAELIEKIFRNQKESHFVAARQQSHRREEDREHSIPSILDFPGFF